MVRGAGSCHQRTEINQRTRDAEQHALGAWRACLPGRPHPPVQVLTVNIFFANTDYALAMRLQSEEDAAASLSRSAPASKLRSRHRHEVVRLDSTAFGCPAGQWDGEDLDDDAVVDAQVEEEEAQFAALVGTMGHRSRGAGRSAWTTKHDARLTGRRNARRLEHQHPTVGDLTGRGTKLSNRVAGDLTRHFSKQTRKGVARSGRVEGATVQTQEGVMDGEAVPATCDELPPFSALRTCCLRRADALASLQAVQHSVGGGARRC